MSELNVIQVKSLEKRGGKLCLVADGLTEWLSGKETLSEMSPRARRSWQKKLQEDAAQLEDMA